MDGEQVGAALIPNSVQQVTSVGNSWIISRSKSHSGRNYYFNTLTGESVWNLSNAEIEKAKKTTKLLKSQSGGKIEDCPEPKDPPIDILTNRDPSEESPQTSQVYTPSRVYNKQIINNQFSRQTIAPFISPHCSHCNSETTIEGVTVNLPVAHNCHSNVWTLPPNHQLLIAPTSAPMFNQSQNVPFNNPDSHVSVQNTSLPLSRRFHQMRNAVPSNKSTINHGVRKFIPKNYNNTFKKKGFTSHLEQFNETDDLRRKLTARKRSNSWNRPENMENGNHTYQDDQDVKDICNPSRIFQQKIQIINPAMQAATNESDADDEWLKENASLRGTHLKLNITPLKEMLSLEENSCFWYIVADTNVLLNNINLITVIVSSDELCQLMVPDYIMANLQDKSRLNNTILMSRAHRVLQILSQQFADGCAVIGKDPSSNEGLQIYNFCYKLLHQGCNVVLISNNIQLERHKNDSDIPILTIKEVKDLLSNSEPTEPVNPLSSLNVCHVKITVPNDVTMGVSNTSDTSHSECDMPNEEDFCDAKPQVDRAENPAQLTNFQKHVKKSSVSTSMSPDLYMKKNVDVGVQTDSDHMDSSNTEKFECMSVYSEKSMKTLIITQSDEAEALSHNTYANEAPKRREIRLKRNPSHQAVANNAEQKHFKWRRRKRIESAPQTTVSEQQMESNYSPIRNDGNFVAQLERSACNDEPLDSSETSSSFCVRKNGTEKIVVEETSTSGIISNTASNVDSESVHSMKPNEQINYNSVDGEKDTCKCAMFEVESPIMEEYLKTRCDEWISRFVQIMEEVLTQILQQDPPFINGTLPPPWTIHEATECIKRKFANDNDVLDAANKLTCVLFKISDGRGIISPKIKPAEFMEMYSYGVYLVDSLQTVLSDCEDLQTAVDSLAKLLSDIQNLSQDNNHADSFLDVSNHPAANITQADNSDTGIVDACDNQESSVQKKARCHLRFLDVSDHPAANITQAGNSDTRIVDACDNQESSFEKKARCLLRFLDVSDHPAANITQAGNSDTGIVDACDNQESSFEKKARCLLRFLDHPAANITQAGNSDTRIVDTCDNQESSVEKKTRYLLRSSQKKGSQDNKQETEKAVKFIRKIDIESTFFTSLSLQKKRLQAGSDRAKLPPSSKEEIIALPALSGSPVSSKCDDNTETQKKPNNEPKIIRNFSKCLAFEEKLKSKTLYLPDFDILNYSEDEGEEGEYDYCDENYDGDYDYYADEGSEIINDTGAAQNHNGNEYNSTTKKVDKNDNSNFDWIIEKFIHEIQDTFLDVHSFCSKSREEIGAIETVNSPRKFEIREKAEKARVHMSLLCKSLNGIIYRENTNSGKNIEGLLKEAGIHIDNTKLVEYRSIISKYSHQARLLLEAVNIVIEAVQ